jgi:hypothetical protein
MSCLFKTSIHPYVLNILRKEYPSVSVIWDFNIRSQYLINTTSNSVNEVDAVYHKANIGEH